MFQLWDLLQRARSGQIDPSELLSELSNDDDDYQEEETDDESIPDQEAEQKITQAETIKARANEHFKNGRYEEATKDYTEATQILTFIGRSSSIKERQHQARSLCLLNRAASNLKLGHNDTVIADCDEVLSDQPDNIKALVRRGNAYMNKEEYELAKEDLKLANRLCPDDTTIKRLLLEVKAKLDEQLQREKKAFGGMFK
jgi:tetratricopeptide (TPR) repeat protein